MARFSFSTIACSHILLKDLPCVLYKTPHVVVEWTWHLVTPCFSYYIGHCNILVTYIVASLLQDVHKDFVVFYCLSYSLQAGHCEEEQSEKVMIE